MERMNNVNPAAPPVVTFRTVARKCASLPKRGTGRGPLIQAGLLSLILALAMQTGLWSVRAFAGERKTAVAAAAILAPRVLITCPHHQQDCPADCLCPKTYTTVATVGADADHGTGGDMQTAADVSRRDASLREPSLAACTQHGPQSAAASSDVFLAAPAVAFFLPAAQSSLRPKAAESLRDGLREPLLKIPI